MPRDHLQTTTTFLEIAQIKSQLPSSHTNTNIFFPTLFSLPAGSPREKERRRPTGGGLVPGLRPAAGLREPDAHGAAVQAEVGHL